MNIFAAIASFLNTLLPFLSVSAPRIEGAPPTNPPAPPQPGAGQDLGGRCKVTLPEVINAHFFSTGSPAWSGQSILAEDGKTYQRIHGGTDFGAPIGSPVFAPRPMTIIATGHYSDAGRMGDYVIGNWENGYQYYSGHLDNVRVKVGDKVECGQQIGQTNVYNHTHIQLKNGNVYLDPEKYL